MMKGINDSFKVNKITFDCVIDVHDYSFRLMMIDVNSADEAGFFP